MLNRATIIGYAGKNPDIRTTASGDKIVTLSIATSKKWKDQSGEQKESMEWHRVVLFGKLAGIAESYIKKGSKVYIEGEIKTRAWDDQSGQKKYTTEIVLSGYDSKIVLLSGFDSGADDAPKTAKTPNADAYESKSSFKDVPPSTFEDEIPF